MIFRGKSEGPKKNLDLKQQNTCFFIPILIFINVLAYPIWKKNLFISFSTIQWCIKPAGQPKAFIQPVKTPLIAWNPINLQSTTNGCKISQHWKIAKNIHSANTRTGGLPP